MKNQLIKCLQLAIILVASTLIMSTCSNESSNPEWISVELSNLNVVYVGVDNPLILAASNHKGSVLEVSTDNGKITGANGSFMLSPAKAGKVVLTISANGAVLGEKHLRALSLPNPTAGVYVDQDGQEVFLQKGEITLKALLGIDEIKAELRDFLWDVDFKVNSFWLSNTGKSGITVIEKSEASTFTEGQMNIIKRWRPGSVVFIEDIYAIGPDGLSRQLNDIKLKIVE